MQIETAEDLIEALRASRLLPPDQLASVVGALAAFRGDLAAVLKYLVKRDELTVYQLRKVLHGKAADLCLGSYVITDRLGEGGMGRVYRARHTPTGREVALKVVRPSLLANPVIRGRYQREVETASTLRHPNIVRVEDAGEANGKYYLAMEFVDGIDLSRLVHKHRPLEVAEVCEYGRQAALGLHHAHESGFVHRDIKPSNIVVAGSRHIPQATEPAVVKVLDMGLVRDVGFEETPGDPGLTRAGTVVGTPDYMAPEQAKNSSGVDHRADLYSLGCTLYFLLVGKPPFPDGSAIEKLLRHQLDAPPPIQALRPDVPGEVAAVIAKLMAKKPAARFASAAVVAEALAPLAEYPHGSQPVPVRVSPVEPAAVDTLPQSGRSTTAPDPELPIARPIGAGVPPDVDERTPAFDTLLDPPSGRYRGANDDEEPLRRTTSSTHWFWVWIGAGLVVAIALLVYALKRGR